MSLRIIIILLCALVLVVNCKQRAAGNSLNEIPEETDAVVSEVEAAPIIKDSLDTLMEQRAEQEFNSTIFAGLRFGSSRQTVEKVLYNKGSETTIPIQVPLGEIVKEVIIRDFDAVYYNGRLASLTLYANEADLLDALASQYKKKYGETKEYDIYGDCRGYEWAYSNCEIVVRTRNRVERVPEVIVNESYTRMYYDTYRGARVKNLTTNRTFLEISYENIEMLLARDRQKHIADSLERDKQLKEAQKEKELANKLEREIPTSI